jgi:hypothetical protein
MVETIEPTLTCSPMECSAADGREGLPWRPLFGGERKKAECGHSRRDQREQFQKHRSPSSYVKCFATTRHSNTDPNVATVAIKLSTVPNTADRTREEGCAGGVGRLLFAFCFFAANLQILLGQVLRPDSDAPRRIVFRSMDGPSQAAAANRLRQTVNRR